jgi:hypothetical protein
MARDPRYDRSVPSLRGIDDRKLSLRAWLHERAGVTLRKLRVRADPIELPPPPFLELTLRARSAGRAESVLHVDGDYEFWSYAERRALYSDFLTGFLLPRTTIYSGDALVIATNSLGCRSAEPAPGRPAVAFFGDSTTLGVMGTSRGLIGKSWADDVELAGYNVLNAGVEALTMDGVTRRYESLRSRVPLAGAVFYTGWHNLIYNQRTPDYWEECLQSYLSPAHLSAICTLPSPLLPEMANRGITQLVNEAPEATISDELFIFWGEWDAGEWLPELLDAHERFNDHVIDFCRRTDTPLIDLRNYFYPDDYETATRDFFDVCHFRPPVYSRISEFMTQELERLLPDTPPDVGDWEPPADLEPVAASEAEDIRRNIYPIW